MKEHYVKLHPTVSDIVDRFDFYLYEHSGSLKGLVLELNSFEWEYRDPRWTILSREVLSENRYKCRICGASRNVRCHHVIPVNYSSELFLDKDNIITVCPLHDVELHRKYVEIAEEYKR